MLGGNLDNSIKIADRKGLHVSGLPINIFQVSEQALDEHWLKFHTASYLKKEKNILLA